jgi:thiol peroxidase
MELTFDGAFIHTCGELPAIGQKAPEFLLIDEKLQSVSLASYAGNKIILNVFPSIDTKVCSSSVMHFNQKIADYGDVVILCVSIDTPFALKRHCSSFDFSHVRLLSDFRQRAFGKAYGLTIIDGPVAGVLARAALLLDENHIISYREVSADITLPIDYQRLQAALEALNRA